MVIEWKLASRKLDLPLAIHRNGHKHQVLIGHIVFFLAAETRVNVYFYRAATANGRRLRSQLSDK